MTFKDISYKIFKASSRRYLSYFLSSSFSIMVFFIYSTLAFNRNFIDELQNSTNRSITPLLGSVLLVIALFTVFFISYAHHSFVKSRNQEFGLFLTLGMTSRDILRIIRTENSIIGLLSLALGLITGTIFARLFFLVVIKILDIQEITFTLNILSYLSTLAIFTLIFAIVIVLSTRFVKKLEITDLLKEKRISKSKKRTYPLLGFIGILMVILSYALFFMHLDDRLFPDQNNWMIVFLAINLIGVYLMTSEFGSLMIALLKKNQSIYFRNLLNLTEIHYKYRSNIKIIYITTILSAVVIFFIGLSYSLYSGTLKVSTEENPYHLSYGLDNKDSNETIQRIDYLVEHADSPIVERRRIEYLDGGVPKYYNGQLARWILPAISESTYNSLSEQNLELKEGEAATILQVSKPERKQWWTDPEIEYFYGDHSIKLSHKQEVTGIIMNKLSNHGKMMIIINDDDYKKILSNLQNEFLKKELYLINFEDWKGIEGLAEKIEEVQFSNLEGQNEQSLGYLKTKPVSRIQIFQQLKQNYGFLLFIMSFIGLLFFFTVGNVLYFKLRNDIEDTKVKFKTLAKLGIHSKEVRKIISSELKLIFYIPLLFGTLIGYGFIYILTVNISIRKDILIDTSLVVVVYFLLQSLFYFLAKRNHLTEISKVIRS